MREWRIVTVVTYKKPVREDEGCGPFRSWWATREEPHEFVKKFLAPYVKEFTYRVFESWEEQNEYYKTVKAL